MGWVLTAWFNMQQRKLSQYLNWKATFFLFARSPPNCRGWPLPVLSIFHAQYKYQELSLRGTKYVSKALIEIWLGNFVKFCDQYVFGEFEVFRKSCKFLHGKPLKFQYLEPRSSLLEFFFPHELVFFILDQQLFLLKATYHFHYHSQVSPKEKRKKLGRIAEDWFFFE